MGSFQVLSYAYYTDGAGSYSNPTGYDTVVSTFEEVSPNIDQVVRPDEVLDPDYSTQPATFRGLVQFGGETFFLMEDQFGSFLGSDSVLPLSSFPTSFLDSQIENDVDDTVPACFLSGTLIASPSGHIAVEDLAIGDPILTADGRTVSVKWVGYQTVHKLFSGAKMQPVRIRAGALGHGLPQTDLTVTADHAMILDGLAINASALVNGSTIDWVPLDELPDRVTYYHIETQEHDAILANGAPAETYVDYVGRQVFDNYADYLELYGAERIITEMPYIRISARRLVPEAIKLRLGITVEAVDFDAPLSA